MAKDTTKGIGKDTLSEKQAPLDEKETVEIAEEIKETAQEQENGVQNNNKENEQEQEKEIVKYKTGYKMLITEFGTFTADENGYFLLTKEQYNKLMKK